MKTRKNKIWRIPKELPPCWWVAIHGKNGTVELEGPYDAVAKARASWVFRDAKGRVEKPLRLEVVPENPKSSLPKKNACGLGNLAAVTARWNWFRRHRKTLCSFAAPKSCHVLIPKDDPPSPVKDLMSHRLGGPAVLPEGYAWPTFRIEDWHQMVGNRPRRYRVLGTFVATLDLRSSFSARGRFPQAISLFICTYNELNQNYDPSFANSYVQQGVVVPLFASDNLYEVSVPAPGVQLERQVAVAFEMPDFPPYDVDLGEVFRKDTKSDSVSEREEVFKLIDRKEPRTSAWINVNALKIGGYEAYIQHSVRKAMAEKYPNLQWHFIAAWSDDRIALGDGGCLYVVAGYDKKRRNWKWHCAWDCY